VTPTGAEQARQYSESRDFSEFGADYGAVDGDLRAVIEAWPNLSADQRADITRLARDERQPAV